MSDASNIKTKYKTQILRRNFLKGLAAGTVFINAAPAFGLVTNKSKEHIKNKKLVWIFLRGALDSLHTIIPTADQHLFNYRAPMLNGIKNDLLALENGYALHPNLPFLHDLYRKKQMSPVVAVASGYRERSHFDAQDQMESGFNITDHDNGWLARAVSQVNGSGIAISRSVPIALRDHSKRSETWYPSVFPEADEDLLSRLSSMYENDESLDINLQSLIAQKQNPNMQMQEKRRANFPYLAQRCGELLASDENKQCAMLELGGWDTHNNQAGRLARLFSNLEQGLQNLQKSLGKTWDDTLVVVTTEFGRTVAMNGTQGTDHGTGASMFFAGGAMKNFTTNKNDLVAGKVLGKWPGLAPSSLYESRDLNPTSDVREWIAKALQQHWLLNTAQINKVFPDLYF